MKAQCIISLIVAALIPSIAADVAQAQDQNVAGFYYNDGRIRIYNGTDSPLAHLTVISMTGDLRDASTMIDLPGAIKDDSEFPFAFTYLNFPVGYVDLGPVAKAELGGIGTFPDWIPVSYQKLHLQFRTGSLLFPLQSKPFVFPEPGICPLVGVAILGLATTNRQHR